MQITKCSTHLVRLRLSGALCLCHRLLNLMPAKLDSVARGAHSVLAELDSVVKERECGAEAVDGEISSTKP
jgi:hypothetical protein